MYVCVFVHCIVKKSDWPKILTDNALQLTYCVFIGSAIVLVTQNTIYTVI